MPSSQSNTRAPVDPAVPVPVPDVDGADATVGGLPRRVDLTWQQKLIVDASALADLGLRTAIASLVGTAMLPRVANAMLRQSDSRAEQRALRLYAELAAAKDPVVSFPAPTAPPRVSSRLANPVAEWFAHGRVQNIRFKSSFEATNPAVRERHQGYEHTIERCQRVKPVGSAA